jgi:hypothetical protein
MARRVKRVKRPEAAARWAGKAAFLKPEPRMA